MCEELPGSSDLFAGHIPLMKPWLGDEEVAAAREVILSGWVSMGPKAAEFESAIASLVGAKHGIATNSATSALHLGILGKHLPPDSDVICPAFTCMATANAILHAGCRVVFAEIEERTFNLDPAHVADLIGPRTRAIMVVHQIGLPADLDAFAALARKHDLAVIEDAATAFGAKYKGSYLGASGNPVAYSFHPRKMITTGEGGMLMTGEDRIASEARVLRSAGASVSDLERHHAKGAILQQYVAAGFNYRFTDIQAAIGLVQLSKLARILDERTRQAAFYDRELARIDGIETPYVPPWATPAWSSYFIKLRTSIRVPRDTVIRRMVERGVSCRKGIVPLYVEPFFRETHGQLRFPHTESAAASGIFLPIFPGLDEKSQLAVVNALESAIAA
jgi:perosamine synthetase